MRYQAVLTIPIGLRRGTPHPLYEQIAGQIGAAVDEGRLATRTALPSTRTLAELLGVSRGVVAAAYDLLSARGYLEGRPGSGSYVAVPPGRTAAAPGPASGPAGAPDEPVDLCPAGPSTELFPVRAWRAAWRQASFRPPPTRLPPPLGLPELRQAVAAHLRDTRGMAPDGFEVVVTAGIAHGLRLVLDALGLSGAAVALEEPVPRALHRAVPGAPWRTCGPAVAGARPGPDGPGGSGAPVPLPVDVEGAQTGAVAACCRAMVVTPDAHEPLGHVLSARRRQEAAQWALSAGGWLVEIACDAVFRPEANRLPRLASLAAGSTVVLGGFGAVLTGLGVGYAVVPAELAGPVGRLISDRAEQPPHIVQLAVAQLFADGVVVRQMHRLGRLYRRKRELLVSCLGRRARLGGLDGVGTAVLHVPVGSDADQIAAALRDRRVLVAPLADYHFSGARPFRPAAGPAGHLPAVPPPGLVIGYWHLPDHALEQALANLARELDELTGPPGTLLPPAPVATAAP